MWRRGDRRERITCIACGQSVFRSDAREYDKYGDRFDRIDKQFEHLCKPCYRELCHQPRDELEDLLVDLEAGSGIPREEFLRRYNETVEERYERNERNER